MGTTMKMASRRIDLISKKTNCTYSTLFCLSLAVVLHDYNAFLKPPHSSLKRNWFFVAEFKIKKRAPSSSSSMAWAACRLFPLPCPCQNKWLSLRCKDFSGFFELIVLGYVKWIFLLSIAVSLYWVENWKLSPVLILLLFSSVRSSKFRQHLWSSDAGKLSIFPFFKPLASM